MTYNNLTKWHIIKTCYWPGYEHLLQDQQRCKCDLVYYVEYKLVKVVIDCSNLSIYLSEPLSSQTTFCLERLLVFFYLYEESRRISVLSM